MEAEHGLGNIVPCLLLHRAGWLSFLLGYASLTLTSESFRMVCLGQEAETALQGLQSQPCAPNHRSAKRQLKPALKEIVSVSDLTGVSKPHFLWLDLI